MTAVGFTKATITVFDEELKPVAGKQYVIKGETDKGVTKTFEISNLTPEALKIYGSDIPYQILQQGVGDVLATFTALDLPFDTENIILGRGKKEGADGYYNAGEDTNPPFCSIVFESHAMNNDVLGFALFAGKFGLNAVSGKTKEGNNTEPDADSYSFAPISKKIDDKNKVVGFARGDGMLAKMMADATGTTEAGTTEGNG
jgi:phi13 family phage major tail protein